MTDGILEIYIIYSFIGFKKKDEIRSSLSVNKGESFR